MMTNMNADGGKNDEIGDSGGNDDEFCSQDEREKVGSKQSEPLGKVDVERRNKNLNQSATVEGSQENAIVLNDDQDERDTDIDSDDLPPWEDDTSTQTGNQLEGLEMSALECHQKESLPTGMEDVISSKMVEGVGSEDLPPCTNDEEYEHRPREDDKGTRTDNQLEGWGISALARHGEECPPISVEDAINPEMVEGEGTQVGGLSRRELTSTPPKFNIDNSPLLPSCDGKAKKTMHFADPLSMTNTKSSDTLEPNHIISEINRDARSDRSIYQPTQEASGHTIPKATTHQPQQPIENKAKRQARRFSYIRKREQQRRQRWRRRRRRRRQAHNMRNVTNAQTETLSARQYY
ncbi:hypothetical protein K469DRAFT_115264 [Zopfia rhizophila CBS 207.26]|uniref:Uncharacterized protein n=1 Tax=Zopfia rhizophila CBS 207.26 TaxID=1314779 RepID=A0A6A6D5J6_9PEZI|nr:hypothetical protein K469DRAFT_115264 [Zopfia rhizophila CBS 207.26]